MNIDLTAPEIKQNPYPIYLQLRDELPICKVQIGKRESAWLITRYSAVLSMLKDERFIKDRRKLPGDRKPWMPGIFRPLLMNMLDLDPPDHNSLRGLVQKTFTPGIVERLLGRIESLTEELLAPLKREGCLEVIQQYALPLPSTIIAELLGIPARDRHKFHRWSAAIVSLSPMGGIEMLWALPSVMAFLRYIRKVIRLRREHPTDDLIGALVTAEERADKLSENELVAMIFLLLVAGHETTINLIGNGILALIENPGDAEKLRTTSALIKSAVEEMLRYYSPVQLTTERWARENVTLDGVTILEGDLVLGALASANRDSDQFDAPDEFKIDREPTDTSHLATVPTIVWVHRQPVWRHRLQ